ncbi:MAG: MinD/ParA family protein [Pseudomonadota bacterium]
MRKKPTHTARVIAVTSGKGGVGKTNVAVNLAIALAERAQRVILWDMDLGLANVDIILNLRVNANLADVIEGNKSVEEIMLSTSHGVQVVPGALGDEQLADLNQEQRVLFIEAIERLTFEADYIIVDTGAGISQEIMGFITAVDDVLVVTTPEPTAMLDAYAAIKRVYQTTPDTHVHLLVNMARSEREARDTLSRMRAIAHDFLGSMLVADGYILYDNVVGDAVRHRAPFISAYPGSPPANAVRKVADAVLRNQPPHPYNLGIDKSPKGFLKRLKHWLG